MSWFPGVFGYNNVCSHSRAKIKLVIHTSPSEGSHNPSPKELWAQTLFNFGWVLNRGSYLTSLLNNNPSGRTGSDKTELGCGPSGKTFWDAKQNCSSNCSPPGLFSWGQTLSDLNGPAQTPSHLTPVSEVFSSCHFLLSWARQRMLSDFQPSGHSRIFSLEGSAGEAKVEAKRQRRGKVEIDPRHTGKRGSRRPQSSCGVTDKGCHS